MAEAPRNLIEIPLIMNLKTNIKDQIVEGIKGANTGHKGVSVPVSFEPQVKGLESKIAKLEKRLANLGSNNKTKIISHAEMSDVEKSIRKVQEAAKKLSDSRIGVKALAKDLGGIIGQDSPIRGRHAKALQGKLAAAGFTTDFEKAAKKGLKAMGEEFAKLPQEAKRLVEKEVNRLKQQLTRAEAGRGGAERQINRFVSQKVKAGDAYGQVQREKAEYQRDLRVQKRRSKELETAIPDIRRQFASSLVQIERVSAEMAKYENTKVAKAQIDNARALEAKYKQGMEVRKRFLQRTNLPDDVRTQVGNALGREREKYETHRGERVRLEAIYGRQQRRDQVGTEIESTGKSLRHTSALVDRLREDKVRLGKALSDINLEVQTKRAEILPKLEDLQARINNPDLSKAQRAGLRGQYTKTNKPLSAVYARQGHTRNDLSDTSFQLQEAEKELVTLRQQLSGLRIEQGKLRGPLDPNYHALAQEKNNLLNRSSTLATSHTSAQTQLQANQQLIATTTAKVAELIAAEKQLFAAQKQDVPAELLRKYELWNQLVGDVTLKLTNLDRNRGKSSSDLLASLGLNPEQLATAKAQFAELELEMRKAQIRQRNLMRRQEITRRRAIIAGVEEMGGGVSGTVSGSIFSRDQTSEALAAYRQLGQAVHQYDDARLSKLQAITAEEVKQANVNERSSKLSLDAAEKEYRLRVLSGKTFQLGGHTYNAVEADAVSRGHLNKAFGPGFNLAVGETRLKQDNLRRSGRNAEAEAMREPNFQEFVSKAYAGDAVVRQKILEAAGRETKELSKQNEYIEQKLRLNKEYAASMEQTNSLVRAHSREQAIMDRLETERNSRQPIGVARAFRGASYVLGGYAAGFAAAYKLREAFNKYIEYQGELAQIQGVLRSKSSEDRALLDKAISGAAAKYGSDLIETANAAKILAQSGLDATGVVKELDFTLLAMRGMDISIGNMQELQIAIRAVRGESASTLEVLDKIARVEARYAVTADDMAEVLKKSTPIVNQFAEGMVGVSDQFDFVAGLSTAIIQQTRATGSQAANAINFMFARLAMPEVLGKLQNEYGLKLAADPAGKSILPVNDLFGEVVKRYRELKKTSPHEAFELASALAGGRRVNFLVAALDKYDEVLEISRSSADAFGDAQRRAEIRMDSLDVKMQRLNTSFTLYIKNLLESSKLSDALGLGLDVASFALAPNGKGGGIGSTIGLVAVVGGLIQAMKKGFAYLSGAQFLARNADLRGTGATPGDVVRGQRLLAGRALGQEAGSIAASSAWKSHVVGGAAGGAAEAASMRVAAGAAARGMLVGIVGAIGSAATAGIFVLIAGSILGGIAHWMKKKSKTEQKADYEKAFQQDLISSPQMQAYRDIVDSLKLGDIRQVQKDLQGVSDNPGANLQSVLASMNAVDPKHAITDFTTLLEAVKEGRVEWAGLRTELTQAFVKDLRDGSTELTRFTDKQAQQAAAIELLGRAVFASSARISEAINSINDSATTMADEAMANLDRLNNPKVMNMFQRFTSGPSLDYFYRQNNLEPQLEKFLKESIPQFADVFTTDPQFQAELAKIKAELGGTGTIKAGTALRRIVEGVDPKRTAFDYNGRSSGKSLEERIADVFLNKTDAFIRLGQADAETRQGKAFEDARNALPDGERAVLDMKQILMDGLNIAISTTQNQQKKTELQSLTSLVEGGANSYGVALGESTTQVLRFTQDLREAFIGLAQDIQRVQIEEGFAQKTGQAYDPFGPRQELFRSMYLDISTVVDKAMGELVTAQGEYGDLIGLASTLKGTQNATPGEIFNKVVEAMETSGTETDLVRQQSLAETIAKESPEKFQQVKDLASGLDRMRELGKNLANILPNTNEGNELAARIESFIGRKLNGTDIEAFKEAMLEGYRLTDKQRIARETTLELAQRAVTAEENLLAVQEANNQLLTSTASKTILLESARSRILQAQKEELNTRVKLGDISTKEAELKQKLLDLDYERDKAQNRRLEMINSENALILQGRDNLAQMISGVTDIASDLSIWESVFDPKEGMTRAAAFGGILSKALDPIGGTLRQRASENLSGLVSKRLADIPALKGLVEGPELALRQQAIDNSNLYYTAIQSASTQGAAAFGTAILEAGNVMRQSVGLDPLDIPKYTLPGVEVVGTPARKSGPDWKGPAALLAGQLGGTLLGRGKPGAQTGSSMGSLLGGAAGTKLLTTALGSFAGPVGMIAGGLLGGLVGGLFGGDSPKETRQIQILEAIEREQRDTITAIENQTDSLLRPQNRLLNLPSTFNVPDRNPSGVASVNYGGDTIHITVDARGAANPESIEKAARDGVSTALSNGRRSRSRGPNRLS